MESILVGKLPLKMRPSLLCVLAFLYAFTLTINALANPAPIISQISPNFGPTNGGTIVLISGSGFQIGAIVSFGTLSAVSVTVNSDTSITAVTPPANIGPVSVTVSNTDGQSSMLLQGYTYHIEPIYSWKTIAGVPLNGALDGTNASARFARPNAVAEDAQGNIYVANEANFTIRKLTRDGTNWISSTLAGMPGMMGTNDGPGNAAQFLDPEGLTADPSGNVYVVDNGKTIRQITPSGFVSTIAGVSGSFLPVDGTNRGIQFSSVSGIAIDTMGNLFVTDNQSIRRLTPVGTNWVSSTLAGVAISAATDLAVDGGGNIYITTASFNSVYQVSQTSSNWTVKVIAGPASGSADGTNGSIAFQIVIGVTVDSQTNVYLADSLNHTIRQLAPQGTNWVSSTLAGMPGVAGNADGTNNQALFFRPQGVFIDTQGNLLVADTFNSTIRELSPVGTNWVTTTIAGHAGSLGAVDGTQDGILFARPVGIAVDNNTNIYTIEYYSEIVRKLITDGTNWTSTTIAGQPFNRGTFDGTNTSTTYFLPQAIAVDSATNLFIADDNSVRKLVPAGTNYVSKSFIGSPTIPGMPPSFLDSVQGLAVDSADDVFISDTEAGVIVEASALVNPPYPPVTIAGTNFTASFGTNDGIGAAIRFRLPTGIAADSHLNLYITDTSSHTIRKLTHLNTSWVSSTIAGAPGISGSADGTNNSSRFSRPMGITVDAQTNLYVADTGNSIIRKLVQIGTNWVSSTIGGLSGTYGSTDGTNNNARFANAAAIAVDASGNLYVADSGNNTLRLGSFAAPTKFDPGVVWQTPAPLDYGAPLGSNQLNAAAAVSGTFTYTPPAGTVLAPGTNVLTVVFIPDDLSDYQSVTSQVNFVVRSFPPVVTISPALPTGVLSNNTTITASVFGPGPFMLQWQVHGTNLTNTFIQTIVGNGTTTVSNNIAATNSGLNGPRGLAFDNAGNLLVADTGNTRVRKISTKGIITASAGLGNPGFGGDGSPATNATLSRPDGVAFTPDGTTYYIADTGNNCIRKVDANGIITTVAGSPTKIAFSGDGGPATNAGLSAPTAVLVDAAGNILIADTSHGSVRKVDTNGIITTIAGKGANSTASGDGGAATNAGLAFPSGLALDAAGNLFIADTSNSRVRKVNPNGIITTVAGSNSRGFAGDGAAATNAALSSPNAVAVDVFGNLFIADTSNGRIRRVGTNGIITTVAGKGPGTFTGDGMALNTTLGAPGTMAVDSMDNLYFVDTSNNRVFKLYASLTLTLTNLTTTNAGDYELIATSPYGTTTNRFSVVVGLPPLTTLNADGQLQLLANGPVGTTYILQTATNLESPVIWKSVATNTIGANGTTSFTTSNSGTNQYYRIKLP